MPAGVRTLVLIAVVFAALSPANAKGLRLDGNAVQGGLMIGYVSPGARVHFEGAEIRLSSEGVFVIGFGRDAPATANLQITFADGSVVDKTLSIEKRRYRIQRIDGLPERKVTPKPSDLERIRREAALVRAARARDDPRTDFLGGFDWPARGPISGVFGSQRILNGEPRRPHFGVDIAAPAGASVRAPAGGIVTLAHPAMFYSGGTLILDHGHGLSSSFLHLSEILVEEGQRVRRGDLIARVGATGRATGAHLDWRMNWFDTRIDPALLARGTPKD
jgi:murein DD-endopeptidase MepM/ murein hydrolase activator NlpD